MRFASALMAAMLLAGACSPDPGGTGSAQDGAAAQAAVSTPIFPRLPRQRIVLMSSLPLVYGDGIDMAGRIAGKSRPHPLYSAMAQGHDLVVADVLDAQALSGAGMMILVQPRALTPQEFVAIDDFVRAGGRLLLFADPMLEWSGHAGLGDPAGPLRSALVSPLLAHWGIELIDPQIESVRTGDAGGLLVHPGKFAELPGKIGDASCRIAEHGLIARCAVGEGRALLVADADLLDPALISDSGESGRANRKMVHDLIRELTMNDTS
ncbi:hypothetical protein [Blastomonas sp. AAP53]|uniref:DUF4350 domain-containing protein n=1 Tax=Blastomonas sp. AAP53 TaxID=1248760 RepID=UPI0002EC2CA4|nr:hypothetical protein [Blastomonas sp. AAP53]